jgi:hypothetical protein
VRTEAQRVRVARRLLEAQQLHAGLRREVGQQRGVAADQQGAERGGGGDRHRAPRFFSRF